MSQQIRSTGYRNAKHYGYTKNKNPDGIGIILDDLFIFSLSQWKDFHMTGPTVVIYQNRQILYTSFENDQPKGLWSYLPNKQYQFYGIGNVEDSNVFALYIPRSDTIVEIEVKNKILTIKREVNCSDENDRWKKIEGILNTKINSQYYSLQNFIQKNFKEPTKGEFSSAKNKSTTYYGFQNGDTLGFSINSDQEIQAIGEFNEIEANMKFGRKYYYQYRQDVKTIEGIFDEKQLYQFSGKRPAAARKTAQDYYRQSTSFMNKFIYMVAADEFYKKINPIVNTFYESYTTEFGQKIIEADHIDSKPNKQYNLQEAKKAIYEEINKKNHTKRSTGRQSSPIRRISPSERRKYTYQQPQIKVQQFKTFDRIDREEEARTRRRKLLSVEQEEIKMVKKIQQEEQRRIRIIQEQEEVQKRKLHKEQEMRKKLRQLELQKQMFDKMRGQEAYLKQVKLNAVYPQPIIKERYPDNYDSKYHRKKIHKYVDEGQNRRFSKSRSRSRTPVIKGITSTARTEKVKSPYKGSGKRNYKYVD